MLPSADDRLATDSFELHRFHEGILRADTPPQTLPISPARSVLAGELVSKTWNSDTHPDTGHDGSGDAQRHQSADRAPTTRPTTVGRRGPAGRRRWTDAMTDAQITCGDTYLPVPCERLARER